MCLEHAIDAGLATQIDAISSLKDANAIALLVKTSFSFNFHGGTFGLNVFTDLGDKWFGSIGRFSTDCKIINLAAN